MNKAAHVGYQLDYFIQRITYAQINDTIIIMLNQTEKISR